MDETPWKLGAVVQVVGPGDYGHITQLTWDYLGRLESVMVQIDDWSSRFNPSSLEVIPLDTVEEREDFLRQT